MQLQADLHRHRQRQRERETSKQTDKQTASQTDRQAEGHMHAHVHAVDMHVHMHTHTMHTCKCMPAHIHVHAHMCTCACTHTHTSMQVECFGGSGVWSLASTFNWLSLLRHARYKISAARCANAKGSRDASVSAGQDFHNWLHGQHSPHGFEFWHCSSSGCISVVGSSQYSTAQRFNMHM